MSGPSISGETLADIIIKTAVNFPDLVRNRTVSEIFSVIAQNDTLLYAVANVTGLEPEAIERTIVVFLKVIPFMKAYRPDRADSTVIQNFTNTSCVPVPTRGEFTNLCLVPALMIIILLSLLNQRIHLVKKCGLTITRPGLCIPVNLLDSYENRFGYACAFGATINRCLDILFFSDYSQIFDAEVVAMQNDPSTPSWAGLFWRILAMLVIGVAYYPFFACLATDYKIVGGFIGLFYSAAWLATMVSQMAQCPLRYETLIFPGDLLAIDLPTYLCLFFLMLKFLFYVIRGLVKHFRRKHTVTSEECEEEDWMGCYKSKYVLKLLEPIPKELRNPDRTTFKDKLKSTVYKWKPEFKYSTRVVCTYTVSLLGVYEIAGGFVVLVGFLYYYFMQLFKDNPQLLQQIGLAFEGGEIRQYIIIIATLVISQLVLFALMALVGIQIIQPIVDGSMDSFLWKQLFNLWPAFLVSAVFFLVQYLLAKFVFLVDRGSVLALDNRRLFHICTYFLFFFNIFLGVVSCLTRILIGAGIGVLFLARTQKSLVARDYELMDPGFNAYIGYLYLEHTHSNPVLVTFCRLLVMSLRHRDWDETSKSRDCEQSIKLDPAKFRHRRARVRWSLAVTLLNNPNLCEPRRREKFIKKDTIPSVKTHGKRL